MSAKSEFLDLIKNNDTIKRYRELEEVINKDKDLKRKIGDLKHIQKQLINAKQVQKKEAVIHFEKIYEDNLKAIENYPLMAEYLDLQEEINDMLQAVLEIIEDGINTEMERKQ